MIQGRFILRREYTHLYSHNIDTSYNKLEKTQQNIMKYWEAVKDIQLLLQLNLTLATP